MNSQKLRNNFVIDYEILENNITKSFRILPVNPKNGDTLTAAKSRRSMR